MKIPLPFFGNSGFPQHDEEVSVITAPPPPPAELHLEVC